MGKKYRERSGGEMRTTLSHDFYKDETTWFIQENLDISVFNVSSVNIRTSVSAKQQCSPSYPADVLSVKASGLSIWSLCTMYLAKNRAGYG